MSGRAGSPSLLHDCVAKRRRSHCPVRGRGLGAIFLLPVRLIVSLLFHDETHALCISAFCHGLPPTG